MAGIRDHEAAIEAATTLEDVAREAQIIAEHYSFAAAALDPDEKAMCLLGNGFVRISDAFKRVAREQRP